MSTVIPFHGKMFEIIVENPCTLSETVEKYPVIAFKHNSQLGCLVPISTLSITREKRPSTAYLQEDGSVIDFEKRYSSMELYKIELKKQVLGRAYHPLLSP